MFDNNRISESRMRQTQLVITVLFLGSLSLASAMPFSPPGTMRAFPDQVIQIEKKVLPSTGFDEHRVAQSGKQMQLIIGTRLIPGHAPIATTSFLLALFLYIVHLSVFLFIQTETNDGLESSS
jgi:hypothetical protein